MHKKYDADRPTSLKLTVERYTQMVYIIKIHTEYIQLLMLPHDTHIMTTGSYSHFVPYNAGVVLIYISFALL